MYSQYMCILLYVNLIWCNSYSIDILSIGLWGVDVFSVYVLFFYMWNLIWCNGYSIHSVVNM